MSVESRDAPEQSRYEIVVDGEVAGVLEYRDGDGSRELVHTEIGKQYGGQGLGGKLVGFAVDDVERRGLELIPTCEFVQNHLRKRAG